jgi:hypothetical protein
MFSLLLRFLALGATANEATVSGARRPLGYIQYTTTGSAAKLAAPTPPSGLIIGYTVIQCVGGATTDYAAWRDDGTAPTASVGMRLYSGQELDYTGDPYNIQFITGSGTPVLNISFYA